MNRDGTPWLADQIGVLLLRSEARGPCLNARLSYGSPAQGVKCISPTISKSSTKSPGGFLEDEEKNG